MATSVGEIIAKLGIQSSIKGDIAKAQMEIEQGMNNISSSGLAMSSKLAKTAAVGGAAAIGVAAVGVAKATSVYMDFEQTVANAASVTGLSGQAFEDAKDNIASVSKELGSSTVFKASDAAAAMYDLASSGYDVANMSADQLKPILDLAAGTQSELAGTTEIMTSTLGQFGLAMEDSGRVADVFARTIGSSKATIDKLGTSLSYVGPVASSLGISIEQTNAALGVLYNSGLDGSQAGTALRAGLASLMDPSADAAATIEAMGLTLDQVNPTARDFGAILVDLAAAGMTADQAMALFGREAGPAMLTLVNGADDVERLKTSLLDAGGAAETMAEQNLNTLRGSVELLKSAMEGLLLEVGGAAAPVFRGLADAITAIIPGATSAAQYIIKLAKGFMEDLAPSAENGRSIMASLGVIFGDLAGNGDTLSTILQGLAGIINVVTGAIATMLKFYEEHPNLVKFMATMLAVGAALATLPAIAAGVAAAGASIAAIITGLVGAIAGGATIVGTAMAILTGPIGLIIAAVALLAYAWYNNWGDIQGKTAKAIDFLKGVFDKAKSYISSVAEHGDRLLLLLGPIGAIVYAFKNWDLIGTYIEWYLGLAVDRVEKYVDKFKGAGKAIITGLTDGIKGAFSGAYTAVKNGLTDIRQLLPFSPAKEGPFMKLPRWDTVLTEPIESSISAVPALRSPLGTALAGIRREIDTASAPGTGDMRPFTHHPAETRGAAGGAQAQPAGDTYSISIQGVTLTQGYGFQDMMGDIEEHIRLRRTQRGIRT